VKLNTDKYNYAGYKIIKVGKKWIPEHRVVMEKYLGRKLNKGEIIHHIDHDIENNKIENLILCKDNMEHVFIDKILQGNTLTRKPIKYKITKDRKLKWEIVR